jgi:hypothetical protein
MQVKDCRSGLKVYRDCFIGQEAVTVIASEFSLSRFEVLHTFLSDHIYCGFALICFKYTN